MEPDNNTLRQIQQCCNEVNNKVNLLPQIRNNTDTIIDDVHTVRDRGLVHYRDTMNELKRIEDLINGIDNGVNCCNEIIDKLNQMQLILTGIQASINVIQLTLFEVADKVGKILLALAVLDLIGIILELLRRGIRADIDYNRICQIVKDCTDEGFSSVLNDITLFKVEVNNQFSQTSSYLSNVYNVANNTDNRITTIDNRITNIDNTINNINNSINQINNTVYNTNQYILQIQTTLNTDIQLTINNVVSSIGLVITCCDDVRRIIGGGGGCQDLTDRLFDDLTVTRWDCDTETTIDINLVGIVELMANLYDYLQQVHREICEVKSNSIIDVDFTDVVCCDPVIETCDTLTGGIEAKYRTTNARINSLQEALLTINNQVSTLQKKLCELEVNDCTVLLPDQAVYYTAGSFLVFTWVLEENPNSAIYQTQTQLRNPLAIFESPDDSLWNTYFSNIYVIRGTQWGTYWSEDSNKVPLIQGWFLDKNEASRFFAQMNQLSQSIPLSSGNPRFSDVVNSAMDISHTGKKLILKRVCFAQKNPLTDKLEKKHGWRKP